MARSAEYPDLPWTPPRSWTKGRPAAPRVVVIHTTEGHENASSAEDGAAYDARRTDGTSTHYFHDSNSTVQCVRTEDRAHTARGNGNRIGIQHELCGRAGQTDAQWDDAASNATLRQAAHQVARDCRKYGIPAVKLTPAQVRNGAKGICGHADITAAYPQDGGTHWDPGPRFPWTEFLALVRQQLAPTTTKQEDTMPLTPQDIDAIAKRVWTIDNVVPAPTDRTDQANSHWGPGAVLAWASNAAAAAKTTAALVLAKATGIEVAVGDDGVDEQAIVTGVLSGLNAEAIAAAIPGELAEQVADELLARIRAALPSPDGV